ncbi:hypothetical protein ABBQ38_007409 [Trebouxia sp. C0009 RCD-2024]
MDSTRQIGIQLPEGLQRLQLHLFANGLVGWSPEAETTISHGAQNDPDGNDSSGEHTAQTVPPLLSLSTRVRSLNLNRSGANVTEEDQGTDANSSSSELGDFANVASDSSEDEEAGSEISQDGHGQDMTDEEQIEAVQAFIVGDDIENPELMEAACMAATQLISCLADSSVFVEPEVVDILLDLDVHLHAVEGGLQLKIGTGVLARSIYIYGDDEEESTGIDDSESEESFAGHAASSSGRTVVAGRAAAEEGVSCPVCLSSYSSSLRMAALGCHHHVCYTCFGRLSRPKLCPLCRAHIASHVEVIL